MLPKKPCFLKNCNFSSLTTNFDKFWRSLFTVAKILNKLTYASFKNVSALILSISPPGGSLSNFFTPIVSSPVQKTIENKVYKLSRYHIISLQFNVLHLCHSLKLVLAPLNTFNSQILLVILLIVLPFDSNNVSSENLLLLYSGYFSDWSCIDFVWRNSVLVTHRG